MASQYAQEKVDRTGFPLRTEHFEAIHQLKRDKELVITRPDKGNGVVLLRRDDYTEKMLAILSQQDKFLRLGDVAENDNTVLQERALQAFLLRAVKRKDLPMDVYNRIRPVGSSRPRMYGLPKIHKEGAPLRPILSMVNAPQHEMARWLTEVLQPVLMKFSSRTIRDTFHFCDNLDRYLKDNVASDTVMCSFDVVSLFTNIPLAETINICLDTLYRDSEVLKPTIPEDFLRKLLMKATCEVEFSFDEVMYRQVDGVAMGSPLGPVLANIFVGFCESTIDERQWPRFYNRFVDDTFTIFDGQRESQEFFETLNNLHPSLRFTVERESDGCLPFMDARVQRVGELFVRSVYRKPTFTGLYTRWDSFGPQQPKKSLIRSLTFRAVRICSASTLKDEIANLEDLFSRNGYPSQVVDEVITEVLARHRTVAEGKAKDCLAHVGPVQNLERVPNTLATQDHPPDPPDPGEPDRAVLRLPWLGLACNRYKRLVKDAVVKCFPRVKPTIVFTTRPAFNGRAKDVLPTTSKSNVVYLFTCSCGRTYVGRTSQVLRERIKQHVPEELFRAKRYPGTAKRSDSAVTKHLRENPQCVREDLRTSSFLILAQARNQLHLSTLEALHIQRLAPKLCNQKEHVHALSLF